MRTRLSFGNFELMVMLVLIRLGEDAYGVPISTELEEQTGSEVALGSVYAALERLEKKGFVSSTLGNPTAERGGRAKRYFRVTAKGLREVRAARRIFTTLWRDVPALKGGMA
jgi:DNA-binding PadR family transcriptional regulator